VVDLYVEYSGTIYSSHLKHAEAKNAEQVYAVIADELYAHFDLHVLEPLGFNNSFCLAVRPEMAEAYDLKTFSDLAKVSSAFAFGGSAEILNRFDGMPNLKRVYNMSFREEKAIDGPARYLAIANDETQVTEAFTTDGLLLVHDLVVLEDDKSFFPPYQGVIVIDNKMLEKHPELAEVLALLDGKLSNEIMRNLNYKVDVLGESPEAVAEGFLRLNGLLG
jgi:osmoprotectant transport system permease protein